MRATVDSGSSPARRWVLTLATRLPLASGGEASGLTSGKSTTATMRTGTREYPMPASVLPPGCHCCA